MKKLIRTILKETIDNRIVDVLIKMKLTNYGKIKEFLKETGYDEDEVKEIYSIYFESISNLEFNPSNWMNFYFSPDQLEVVTSKKYPNSVFFRKNGKVVMEKEYKDFWFDYDEIWSFFKSFLGMEHQQIQEFLSYWLEETLKIKGYTPKKHWFSRN